MNAKDFPANECHCRVSGDFHSICKLTLILSRRQRTSEQALYSLIDVQSKWKWILIEIYLTSKTNYIMPFDFLAVSYFITIFVLLKSEKKIEFFVFFKELSNVFAFKSSSFMKIMKKILIKACINEYYIKVI